MMEGQPQGEQMTGAPPPYNQQVQVQYVQAQPQVQYVQAQPQVQYIQQPVGAQQVVVHQQPRGDDCCGSGSNMVPGQDMGKYSCVEVSMLVFDGLRFFGIMMWFISSVLIYAPYPSYQEIDPCEDSYDIYCYDFNYDFYERAAPGVLTAGLIMTVVFIIQGALHVKAIRSFRKAVDLEKRKNWLTAICVIDSVEIAIIIGVSIWMMAAGFSCDQYYYYYDADDLNDCSAAVVGAIMIITFGPFLGTVHLIMASLACAHVCGATTRRTNVVYVQGNQVVQQQIPMVVVQPSTVQVAPGQMQAGQPYIQAQHPI